MITGPFLFTAKNRKCSYHVRDFFVPLCNPTLISCSVVLWKDLTDFFMIYVFHFICCICCIWKDFWKDDFLLSTSSLVHSPLIGNKTWLHKGSEKLWCVCHTLLSRRVMLLLVIKGNQQPALQQSQTGRGSNYTLFIFFLARWAEVGGCDEKQEKGKEVFFFHGGEEAIRSFNGLAASTGCGWDPSFQILHWLVVSYRTGGWIPLCVWDNCSLLLWV